MCGELLELRPNIVRGNPSEIMALAGVANTTKGVDSTAGEGKGASGGRWAATYLPDCVQCLTLKGKVDEPLRFFFLSTLRAALWWVQSPTRRWMPGAPWPSSLAAWWASRAPWIWYGSVAHALCILRAVRCERDPAGGGCA